MKLKQIATAARFLAVDMIERAKSGHPGMPLGMADVATVLWSRFLKFDAAEPEWADRDRFVLSGGHGSALLYALLYLFGVKGVTLDDLKEFRQLGSRTAGHPERGALPMIEYSTGPLGQGVVGAVGMALAERMLNARYGDNLVNHKTYVFCGDGDLMEGVVDEAVALAGHWGLNRLILLWDDNKVTIDGRVDIASAVNMRLRFEANGWRVLGCDGHDYTSIEEALTAAQESDRPVLIDCRTVIGFGAPTKQGTPKAHGSPLGADEVVGLRAKLDWAYEPFDIPADILETARAYGACGEKARSAWQDRLAHDGNKDLFLADLAGVLPDGLTDRLADYKKDLIDKKMPIATRKASQGVLEVLTDAIPNLIGGAADLAAACFTDTSLSVPVARDNYAGNYIHYGVREHAMAGIMNGLAAHGGFIPYGGTFLSFVDYLKPAMRLGALMGLREIFVLTHDSVGVGEDGPTHQPIEQLAGLRATPNLLTFRPADSVETVESYEIALNRTEGPSAIALSRQALPVLRTDSTNNLTARGGYVIYEPDAPRQATIIATGSEVSLAMEAAELLKKQGVAVAVVSMPCMRLFEEQPLEYCEGVLGDVPRVIVEAASTFGWDRFLGESGAILGIDSFGSSGKGADVLAHFGFTPESVAEAVLLFVK